MPGDLKVRTVRLALVVALSVLCLVGVAFQPVSAEPPSSKKLPVPEILVIALKANAKRLVPVLLKSGPGIAFEFVELLSEVGTTRPGETTSVTKSVGASKHIVLEASATVVTKGEHEHLIRGRMVVRATWQVRADFSVDMEKIPADSWWLDKEANELHVIVPDVRLGPIQSEYEGRECVEEVAFWAGYDAAAEKATTQAKDNFTREVAVEKLMEKRGEAAKMAKKKLAELFETPLRKGGLKDIKVVVHLNTAKD
jgi:hypothetical protein